MPVLKNTNDIATAAAITAERKAQTKPTVRPVITFDPETGELELVGNAAHTLAKRIKGLRTRHAGIVDRKACANLKREISDSWAIFCQIVEDLPRGQRQDALQILGLELEGVSLLRGKLGYNLQMR